MKICRSESPLMHQICSITRGSFLLQSDLVRYDTRNGEKKLQPSLYPTFNVNVLEIISLKCIIMHIRECKMCFPTSLYQNSRIYFVLLYKV